MIFYILFFGLGLLGVFDGVRLIKTEHSKKGWTVLITGILTIIISVHQSVLYLFFERPDTSVAIWSSRFMYNANFLVGGILLLFLGINLFRNGSLYQKIKAISGIVGGSLMALFGLLELLFR